MHGRRRTGSTFGNLKVFDNALREGADPSSTLIGRARGLGVFASLDNSGGVTTIEFVFSNYGNYSGSTLATLGHLAFPGSERSIVGGTGVLRFARGYFTTEIISSTSDYLVALIDIDAGAADDKLTHLQFYLHEVPSSAPNATTVKVAGLNVYVTANTELLWHRHKMLSFTHY
ncbi:hypothetical protein U9M48_034211 [Paspalum notatum var. saurae]|uniref:Dirigent protein n=1 Tax=Paspalum notatum var. saurae TaxID=547442 RepID=A0AAQ3U9A7_PASNO